MKSKTRYGLILDMDGVLWREHQPIGDLPTIFSKIEDIFYRVVLVTNNATLTPEQYIKKLATFKVSLEPWQIITSAEAVACHLRLQYPQGGCVYTVGESGLLNTLAKYGFFQAENGVCAVVAGMDRSFDYHKLTHATRLIRAGVAFIGTNPDPTFPTPEGLVPGAGAILSAIETASGVKPLIMGKPASGIFKLALDRLQTNPGETLAVGDRLETDVLGAQKMGLKTALVLSGVTSSINAEQWVPRIDYIATDLETLLDQLVL